MTVPGNFDWENQRSGTEKHFLYSVSVFMNHLDFTYYESTLRNKKMKTTRKTCGAQNDVSVVAQKK
jgi:hypothetical protein